MLRTSSRQCIQDTTTSIFREQHLTSDNKDMCGINNNGNYGLNTHAGNKHPAQQ